NESLGIQTEPGALTFEPLYTGYNPVNAEFNSTITRPLYWLGPTGYYEFVLENVVPPAPENCQGDEVPYLGKNCDGYELDHRDDISILPDPDEDEEEDDRNVDIPIKPAYSWGFDIDTHYLSHTLLESFA